ncbi:MAG: toll/interleukin-1 receptor domain-containing protein [Armatimonadota bacterium]|nr:toll/interleukin-1 receptor domain-containing protein [Armatimonadota bacterium]
MAHHDVFISYSTLDKPTADAVCAALESHSIRCWVAPRDITPGQDWSDAIIDAIGDCRVCLLILSAASNQSDQVKREVQNAVSEAKPILPFRIEDVALSKHMRYFIGTPHWLDAMTPPMERHLQKMVETVTGLIVALDNKSGEAPPGLPTPQRISFSWDEALLARIEAELRQFVGPLGRTLVTEAAQRAQGYDDLCRRPSISSPSVRDRHF